MKKFRIYGAQNGKIIVRVCVYESSLKSFVNALEFENYCFVVPLNCGGWRYSFYKNGEFRHKCDKKHFQKLTKDDKDFLLIND